MVLDYGGDRGQFIPESLGKEKYIFEISDALPVEGVTRIASEAVLRRHPLDFIMVCHVLEHCSDQCATLRTFKELGHGTESLYYIEVPYERFDLTYTGRGKFYEWYLNLDFGQDDWQDLEVASYDRWLVARVIAPGRRPPCHCHRRW